MVNKMISRSSWKIITIISNALNNGLSKYIRKKLKLWRKKSIHRMPYFRSIFLIYHVSCTINSLINYFHFRFFKMLNWNIFKVSESFATRHSQTIPLSALFSYLISLLNFLPKLPFLTQWVLSKHKSKYWS